MRPGSLATNSGSREDMAPTVAKLRARVSASRRIGEQPFGEDPLGPLRELAERPELAAGLILALAKLPREHCGALHTGFRPPGTDTAVISEQLCDRRLGTRG